MASAPVKTNDELAVEQYNKVADQFMAESRNAVWVFNTANADRIEKARQELGLDFDLPGLKISALYCLSQNRLELKPVAAPAPVIIREPAPAPEPTPAPKRYRGSQQEILEQIGYKPTLRESPDELAAAAKQRADKVRSTLEDLRGSAQRQKDAEQRFAEEHEVVFRPNGRIDHAASDRKQKAARERWAQRDRASKS